MIPHAVVLAIAAALPIIVQAQAPAKGPARKNNSCACIDGYCEFKTHLTCLLSPITNDNSSHAFMSGVHPFQFARNLGADENLIKALSFGGWLDSAKPLHHLRAGYLPRNSEFIFKPTALRFLAAICKK